MNTTRYWFPFSRFWISLDIRLHSLKTPLPIPVPIHHLDSWFPFLDSEILIPLPGYHIPFSRFHSLGTSSYVILDSILWILDSTFWSQIPFSRFWIPLPTLDTSSHSPASKLHYLTWIPDSIFWILDCTPWILDYIFQILGPTGYHIPFSRFHSWVPVLILQILEYCTVWIPSEMYPFSYCSIFWIPLI